MTLLDINRILYPTLVQSPFKKPIQVKNIVDDHRLVTAGDIFVAVKGSKFDGHTVVVEALKKRPVCVVVETIGLVADKDKHFCVLVKDSRQALDLLAAEYFDFPSEKLFCAAVTGTNGKTTTTHMIEHLLNKCGDSTGVIGTIDHHFKHHVWKTKTTTPGSLEFSRRLAEFVNLGATCLSMEASSHALDQGRLDSLVLDVGVFTNLTRDHLDYHKTVEHYFKSKVSLFTKILNRSYKRSKYAVLNMNDPLVAKTPLPDRVNKITFGPKDATLTYKILNHDFGGVEFEIRADGKKEILKLRTPGIYNIENALAAVAVGWVRYGNLSKAIKGLQNFKGVRGRLEPVENERGIHAFVDYAHTPDALDNVLKCLSEVGNHLKQKPRIITIFGCGGDRDPGKRPLMGKIAQQYSNHVVVTSDNPRSENPNAIIEDIKKGMTNQSEVSFEADRSHAMRMAIEIARPGDVILIAGKGHETYQIIGDKTLDFDDVSVMAKLLT